MMTDTRIKIIHDFEDAKKCFSGLHIDGGGCCSLWDKNCNGKIKFNQFLVELLFDKCKNPSPF